MNAGLFETCLCGSSLTLGVEYCSPLYIPPLCDGYIMCANIHGGGGGEGRLAKLHSKNSC